jgi:cephalosporin-C deacetylase-like acetyl esterase
MRRCPLFAVTVISSAMSVWAADAPDESAWRRMIESRLQVSAFLEGAARVVTDRAATEIATRQSWEQVRGKRLEELRDMLGLLPWPSRTPLNVRVTGILDQPDYTIEKIAFESMPKFYVTGNLYIPKHRQGRVPAIVYVCGHAPTPYGAKTQYQRHGISFARNGYVAFILDPIQLSETFALHHGVGEQDMYDWYSRGYTPAGPEVWNVMRAIDYLDSRTEVDPARIGITGRSGGAAMSFFAAALDPRIKVAAPVMGISTYAADVQHNTQRLHCDCMFPINAAMHDMMHQGALIAPRPLLMAHGSRDDLFPVAGYTEFQERVGALYAAYGHAADFENVVVDTAHADSDYLRERVLRWFDRFFLNASARPLDMSYTNLPDRTLTVFGGSPPPDAQNFRIHETFTAPRPAQPTQTLQAWKDRRAILLSRLKSQMLGALPDKVSGLQVEPIVNNNLPSSYHELRISSQHTVPVRALIRRPARATGRLPALLYIASDGDTVRSINDSLVTVNEHDASIRMILFPRGVGEVPWDRTFWKDTLRNAMFVGETVDSMRLADVMTAVAALRADVGVDTARILVAGSRISGALGLYAAIFDPGIEQVLLIDPPLSHTDGPVLLNVLRYTDLPEVAALLAPRRLDFYARIPAAYSFTRHVYQLYGQTDHLFLTMSIHGPLEGRYDHNFGASN